MTISESIILILSGILAGFMNTVASSGTAVTLPTLIFLGIDPLVANGTNRLPVFLGFLTSALNFAKAGKIPWKPALILAIPIACGTAVGAIFVGALPKIYTELFVIIALFISLILVFLRPGRFLVNRTVEKTEISAPALLLTFAIGIWAGIIVLDSAIFVLFMLVILLKYDLIQANAMKSFLILIVGLVSLGVFFYNGIVDWQAGIILSIGSIIGAYIGSNFAMQESSRVWVFRIIKVILAFELISLITRSVLANSHVL